ncbi:MAG: hypothetical protein VX865_01010 [Candidatus Thermoplasmatota archaeon]|nr:hypothetical protein [Candidatus Thermoplasmatota archaeon]
MSRIVILGESLAGLCAAHRILDLEEEAEIHIFTEKAEIGLMGEIPGLMQSWPPCPPHWLSNLAAQKPNHESTAVRGAWFLKALGIQLSIRGCIFHLRTRVTAVSENRVDFVGAGQVGSGTLVFNHLIDIRLLQQENPPFWYGVVCRTEDSPASESEFVGKRTDGTTEAWSKERFKERGKWLQTIEWSGTSPGSFITEEVRRGIEQAEAAVETIIQNTAGQ